MKRILSFLGAIIACCFYCMATETPIVLESEPEDWERDKRSLTIIPSASHDGNILYLSSDLSISDLQVIIRDENGNVVYSSTVVLSERMALVLPVEAGNYSIELLYGEEYLYGYFSIE